MNRAPTSELHTAISLDSAVMCHPAYRFLSVHASAGAMRARLPKEAVHWERGGVRYYPCRRSGKECAFPVQGFAWCDEAPVPSAVEGSALAYDDLLHSILGRASVASTGDLLGTLIANAR